MTANLISRPLGVQRSRWLKKMAASRREMLVLVFSRTVFVLILLWLGLHAWDIYRSACGC